MKHLKKLHILILQYFLFFISFNIYAQESDYPHTFPVYSFIDYESNELMMGKKSNDFEDFFKLFDDLIKNGKGKINIVHLGASHIQADMFTGRIRHNFFNFVPGLVSNRGYVFPYSMAKTNHPYNYHSDYTGEWETCRNVESSKSCNLGVGGIVAKTSDTAATFNMYFRKWLHPEFQFNDIKVLHADGDSIFDIELITREGVSYKKIKHKGYTQFIVSNFLDTLSFQLVKSSPTQRVFETYGIICGIHGFNGLTYNAIGINGASVPSYLRCNLLQEHLALLEPHLIILSIGVNDAHDNNFTPERFKNNYNILVNRIRKVAPKAHIIFMTNSDSYIKRRTPNNNSVLAKEIFYELNEMYKNTALWDWHSIMGGLGSIAEWEKHGLANKDRIHLIRDGYFLSGDLLFSALIKSYENYIKNKNADNEQ